MDILLVVGLVVAGIIFVIVAAAIAVGALFCGDIMCYTDKGNKLLNSASVPAGRALIAYNPGVSGAARNAAAAIARDLQAKGYSVNLAGIKSKAAADISGYDAIIVGGPMYFGRVSNSVDAYLAALKPKNDVKLGVFATTGSPQFHDEDIVSFGKQVAALPWSNTSNKTAATKTIRSGDAADVDCSEFVSAVL